MNRTGHRRGFVLSFLFFVPYFAYQSESPTDFYILFTLFWMGWSVNPDIDIHTSSLRHRNAFTHSLMFPIVSFIVFYTMPFNIFSWRYIYAFSGSTFIHLLLDLKIKNPHKCGSYKISLFKKNISCIGSFIYLLVQIVIYVGYTIRMLQ